MKYFKGIIPVEAFQLNSRGLIGEDWFWDAVTENKIITHNFGKYYSGNAWCEIKGENTISIAVTGDYIIRDIFGKIYSCRASEFNKKYKKFGK